MHIHSFIPMVNPMTETVTIILQWRKMGRELMELVQGHPANQ